MKLFRSTHAASRDQLTFRIILSIVSIGDPTDIAILKCIEEKFGELIDFERLHPKVYEIPFNSVNKFQLTVHETAKGYRIIMKGAPELIIQRCSTVYMEDANQPMNETWINRSNYHINKMAGMGHRVIGYCDIILDPELYPKNFAFTINELGVPNFPLENNMQFLGIVSMYDPLRPNTLMAVKRCRLAKIKVIMITGRVFYFLKNSFRRVLDIKEYMALFFNYSNIVCFYNNNNFVICF